MYLTSWTQAIQSGTLAFIWELKKKKILDSEGIVKRLKGDELTVDYLNEHGLVQPILVEDKDGLGIVVPDDTFTILDVEKHVGVLMNVAGHMCVHRNISVCAYRQSGLSTHF